MKSKSRESRKHRIKANVQAMIDKAPVKSRKGGYIKLPKGIKFFQPKKSEEMRLVFIPWAAGSGNHVPKGDGTINRYLKVHNTIGVSETSILCPGSIGKPCPQCEEFNKLRRKSREKSHWNAIKDLRPQDREMFLLHDLDGEKNNLQLWEESCFVFGDNLRVKINRKEKYKNFSDPDAPMVVNVLGQEKKMGEGGSFTMYSSIELEDLDSDVDLSGVYDKAESLCPDEWLILQNYKSIEKMLQGDEDEDEDDDTDKGEEEEDEDEDEDEDEENEAEEGNGDARSRWKKKAKSSREKEEAEESEETEEEEEAEEDNEPTYKKGDKVTYKKKVWTITLLNGSKMKLKNYAGKTVEISDPNLVSLVEEPEEEEEAEEPEEEETEEEEAEEPEEEEEEAKPKAKARGRRARG